MKILVQKRNTIFKIGLLLFLAIMAVTISWITAQQGEKVGILIVGLIVGISFTVYGFINPVFGFYVATILAFFIFYIARLLSFYEGVGTILDIVILITFVGVLLQKYLHEEPLWKNPDIISILFLIYLVYIIIEFFNPNGLSFVGNISYLRIVIRQLVIFYIALNIFKSYKNIAAYFKLWCILAFLCAIYGCYQEWFGLTGFEKKWLYSSEQTVFLYVMNTGMIRKVSTLSDPTSFGILMAISALFTMVMALATNKIAYKIVYFIAIFFMLLGMSYSGTRTATFAFTLGIAFYILMTIHYKKTLVFAAIFSMLFVVLIYGPFYGNITLNRIRSTFNFSEDASMQVRDNNRKAIQPYIYEHPLGGGLGTTGPAGAKYSSSHPLAGFPTDSGLLKAALEIGWVGLVFLCVIYFFTLQQAIKGYFRTKNKIAKTYLLAAVVALFSNTVIQYSQSAIGQVPQAFFYYGLIAMIIKINYFEKKEAIINY